MKALSAEFRGKVRFFVVHAVEDSKNAEFEDRILKMYNVNDRDMLPELIVEQTFDVENNETYADDREPDYHKYK
jgi:hypothetical protein